MLSPKKNEEFRKILSKVFPSDVIPDEVHDLKMGDLNSWDSLGNFNLILEIEAQYDIRFSMDQLSHIRSISDIAKAINENND